MQITSSNAVCSLLQRILSGLRGSNIKSVETCTLLTGNIAVHPMGSFVLIKRSSSNRTVLQ